MKEKLKKSLTISEKDKKLLVYVFAFLIVFLAYFVGFQNLSTALDTSTKQVTELTKKKKDLTTKNENKAKYESDTLTLKSESSKLFSTFENGTSQPATLQFLNSIESSTGVWVKNLLQCIHLDRRLLLIHLILQAVPTALIISDTRKLLMYPMRVLTHNGRISLDLSIIMRRRTL